MHFLFITWYVRGNPVYEVFLFVLLNILFDNKTSNFYSLRHSPKRWNSTLQQDNNMESWAPGLTSCYFFVG